MLVWEGATESTGEAGQAESHAESRACGRHGLRNRGLCSKWKSPDSAINSLKCGTQVVAARCGSPVGFAVTESLRGGDGLV